MAAKKGKLSKLSKLSTKDDEKCEDKQEYSFYVSESDEDLAFNTPPHCVRKRKTKSDPVLQTDVQHKFPPESAHKIVPKSGSKKINPAKKLKGDETPVSKKVAAEDLSAASTQKKSNKKKTPLKSKIPKKKVV